MTKDIDYYLGLDWTLVEGTDLDFNGNPYHYIEIKEFPSFAFCAKTREIALANYKNQLRLMLQIMIEDGERIPEPGEDGEDDERIPEPGEDGEDDVDWESICPG